MFPDPRETVAKATLPILLVLVTLATVGCVDARAEDEETRGTNIRRVLQWNEREPSLEPTTVVARARSGSFASSSRGGPSFGIGSPPVWQRYVLESSSASPRPYVLVAGATWTDRLDVFQVRGDRVLSHHVAGDSRPGLEPPDPGIGYVFELTLPPGRSEVYLRAENVDPLLLPVRWFSPGDFQRFEQGERYLYGLVHGVLIALALYNLFLFVGTRERSHGSYALYLVGFLLLNVAYTGHGFAWLWPGALGFQRYVILVLMVAFGCLGLRFAKAFLDLSQYAPRAARGLDRLCLAALAGMLLAIAFGRQADAARLAFAFVAVYAVLMLALGVGALRRESTAGRYFLVATAFGVVGAAGSDLTVWGMLPYSMVGFRAAEAGLVAEAALFAFAVAHQVRQHQRARFEAESMARTDVLTGLLNRRAFEELAEGLWNTATRGGRPLSLVLLDLDHFKTLNDRHGHAAGDAALRATARVLVRECRKGDLVARWGGEEFVVMLPETSGDRARVLAERLRLGLAAEPIDGARIPWTLRASFGVVDAASATSLEELVHEADLRLYRAKQAGRNRVCSEPDDENAARSAS